MQAWRVLSCTCMYCPSLLSVSCELTSTLILGGSSCLDVCLTCELYRDLQFATPVKYLEAKIFYLLPIDKQITFLMHLLKIIT